MVELDVRTIPHLQRKETIFEKWNSLKPGETLQITNDHDPKPLRSLLEAEKKSPFEWQYVQSGPTEWVVRIKKG